MPCRPGRYKEELSNDESCRMSCPDGADSLVGASSLQQCFCLNGAVDESLNSSTANCRMPAAGHTMNHRRSAEVHVLNGSVAVGLGATVTSAHQALFQLAFVGAIADSLGVPVPEVQVNWPSVWQANSARSRILRTVGLDSRDDDVKYTDDVLCTPPLHDLVVLQAVKAIDVMCTRKLQIPELEIHYEVLRPSGEELEAFARNFKIGEVAERLMGAKWWSGAANFSCTCFV